MKIKRIIQRLLIYSSAIILFFACKKSLNEDVQAPSNTTGQGNQDTTQILTNQGTSSTPYPTMANYNCAGPNYGDSIIYPQPTSLLQDYIVKPVNNPGSGKYFSWPDGLVLNSTTGAINVTQSATGQRYSIGFVKDGTTDTCLQTLIIGGAAYSDSVYVLSKNQTMAIPYFDANPNITSICIGSGQSGSPNCSWDINGVAKLMQVEIDNHTGVIDLEKSLSQGLFGLLPINGTAIQVDIYYTLNDKSNQAIQHTPVKLIYYDKKSSIPQSLLDQITSKRTNILDQVLILFGGNPRPPLIIITRDEN